MSAPPPDENTVIEPVAPVSSRPDWLCTEDWWAVWLGALVLLVATIATWSARPAENPQTLEKLTGVIKQIDEERAKEAPDAKHLAELTKEREKLNGQLAVNPTKSWLAKLGSWDTQPAKAFLSKSGQSIVPGLIGVFLCCAVLFSIGIGGMGESVPRFLLAFLVVFLLAVLAFVLAGQKVIKHYNLEYALWAILVGLIISNTIRTPKWLMPAVRTEFYIKTGLVLLGAEILFSRLLSLGVPGIFVSWITTPVVLISTFIFGQRILKISSPSLNMVISADMSVCGVSAAIATGAACKAKREELSLAIALSLGFTVIMMVLMPAFIRAVGMNEVIAGAWLGGTIDSTGAVAAAGGMLGETALTVAATVKMIQNILIGVVAFCVSIYWIGWVERDASAPRLGIVEIWRRFPKFMLGFLAASFVFSVMASSGPEGEATTSAVLHGTSQTLRGWLFCLAFVSIGLETNIRELAPYFHGGKALTLYVVGQTLNLIVSLFMCWLMFEKVFPHAADALRN